jgi:hypothetical protein
MRELFVLAADNNIKFLVAAALCRCAALRIRPIDFEIGTHPQRDPGMRTNGVDLVRPQRRRFAHALLIFDKEGCGDDAASTEALEPALDRQLADVWGTQAKAIAIEPESDIWIWGADTAIAQALGWEEPVAIRAWLATAGFAFAPNGKPHRPKEAAEALVRQIGLPRSSATYGRIAERISLRRCTDPSFGRLVAALRRWFAAP